MRMMKLESLVRVSRMKTHKLISMIPQMLTCSLMILLVIAPDLVAQSSTASTNSDLAAAMDKVAGDVYKPDIPGAAIIVVKNEKVIFRKGYGLANLELNVPIRPEMVFRLGSITKQFTAVSIMMLAEQGKLSLQDDITKFFPDYPTGGKKITIENLLTHTSGIKDYLGKLWPERMRQDMRPEKLIDLFKNDGLEFEPGARESYSNSNYVLLGVIIEKLSGKEYGQFIEDNIFKPLGMKHSYYERVQEIIPDRVSGYARVSEGFVNAAYISMPQLYAAGGLCSSVDDLALWDAAVYSDKLLKRNSWERLFTPYKLANGETSTYAFGWAISQFEGRAIASHTGGIPGFTTYVLHMPEDHIYVAILSNDRTAEVQPEYVARRLATIAIGKPISEPKLIKLEAKVLDKYVGQYQASTGERATVRQDGDKLFEQGEGDPEVELFPTSDGTFIVKAFDAQITFVEDAQGKVTGLIIRYGDQNISLKKIK
jgi:D-alanyl-D-alanine carboxypeptidase